MTLSILSPKISNLKFFSTLRFICIILNFNMITVSSLQGQTKQYCVLDAKPTILIENKERLLQVWNLEDKPVYWSEVLPDDSFFWSYRRRLETSYSMNPSDLMQSGERNEELLLSGRGGSINRITCLEALLFSIQMARVDMLDNPTEFTATILRKDDRLMVFYYTVDQPGIGNVGWIRDAIEPYLGLGW